MKTTSPWLYLTRKLCILFCNSRALMMKTPTRTRTMRRGKRRGESTMTQESHGVGWLGKISFPPNSSWFGMVAKLLDALIHQQDQGYGGVSTVRTNGVVGITPRLSDMPLEGGRISGAARICLLNGGSYI